MANATGTTQGTISTQNLNPNSGVATPLSSVEVNLQGCCNNLAIQVTGTYTGALSVQVTVDGTNWYAVGGTVVGNSILDVGAGTAAATIASGAQKVYRVPVSGMLKARVTALAAMTGAAVVTANGNL